MAGYPIQKKPVFIAAEMCLYWDGQRTKNWHQMSDQPLNLVDWSLINSTSLASNSSYTENNLHIKRGDQTRCSSARDIYYTHSYLSKPGAYITHSATQPPTVGVTKGFISLCRLLSNTFTHTDVEHLCSYLHRGLLTIWNSLLLWVFQHSTTLFVR